MTSSLGSLMIIIIIITAITTIMIVSCDSDNDESGDDLACSEREKEILKLSNPEFEKKARKYTEDLRRYKPTELSKQITSQINQPINQINSINEGAIESIKEFVELHKTNKRRYDYLVEINENAKQIIAYSRNSTSKNAPHHHNIETRNGLKFLSLDNNNQTFFNNSDQQPQQQQQQQTCNQHQESVRLKPDLRRITATTESSKLSTITRIHFSNNNNNNNNNSIFNSIFNNNNSNKTLLRMLLLIGIATWVINLGWISFGNVSKTAENDDMDRYATTDDHYSWWHNNPVPFFWILNAIIIVIIFAGISIAFHCSRRSTRETKHNNNNNNNNNNKCNWSNNNNIKSR